MLINIFFENSPTSHGLERVLQREAKKVGAYYKIFAQTGLKMYKMYLLKSNKKSQLQMMRHSRDQGYELPMGR